MRFKLLCMSLAFAAALPSFAIDVNSLCRKQTGNSAAIAWDNGSGLANAWHCIVPARMELGCGPNEEARNNTGTSTGWYCAKNKESWTCRCYQGGMVAGPATVSFNVAISATPAERTAVGKAACLKQYGVKPESPAASSWAADFCSKD
jgi:hypothetical protein